LNERWPIYVLIWIALAFLVVRVWRAPDSPGPADAGLDGDGAVTRVAGPEVREPQHRPPERISAVMRHWPVADPISDGPSREPDQETGRDAPSRIAGEHVIRFRDAADARRFAALAEAAGATVVGRLDGLNLLRIRVTDTAQWRRLREALPPGAQHTPNHVVWHPERRVPPEPPEGLVYAPFGAGAPMWLGLDSPWLPGAAVTVAILDDGVVLHGTLEGTPLRVFDLLDGDVGDGGLHGSAMAGLIAGRTGEVPGVAAGVELLSYRVLDPDGSGNAFTLAQAILAAVEAGAAVINSSLGTYGDNLALREAVAYAHARGVTIVASVGNDGLDGTLMYPAGYASVIAVAGVDADGRHLWFSNRGAGVDVAAPGYQLNAAWQDGQVARVSGTSASAALVSGAAARLLSADPTLDPDTVRAIVRATSDDFGAPGHDPALGAGIVNLERMERRDQRGYVEMSARPPHVYVDPRTPDRFTGVFFAQNSGTETAPRVALTVEVDGELHQTTVEAVAPGDNAVMTVDLGPREDSPRTRAVRIEAIVQGAPGPPPPVGRLAATIRLGETDRR